MIDNYKKKKSENEITKYGEEKISQYYLLNEIINIKPFNLHKLDTDNIKEILEYQTLFDLNIEIIVKEKYEKIKEKTEKTIKELLNLNIYNNKEIIYNKEFEEIINNIKQNIGNKSKEQ